MGERVALGFSGGVDSAVAAVLLIKDNFDVMPVYVDVGARGGLDDARSAARALGLRLDTVDAASRLEACVCAPFLDGYLSGITLNPCLLCNPRVKLKALAEYADARGAVYISTGHYAISAPDGIYMNPTQKDQSYQLCLTPPELTRRLILPLGARDKPSVRAIAREARLPVSDKPDSMDICFIEDGDYAAWIERRHAAPPPGGAYFKGERVGAHMGIHHYTVGQRWPELLNGRRLYVSKINASANSLELALWEELFISEVRASNMNWLIPPPESPISARVRARHTRWETPDCNVIPTGQGVIIQTTTPLRAPAPGQAAALYVKDKLIGGGIITEQADVKQ